MTIVPALPGNGPVKGESLGLMRLWGWLTRCAVAGCDARPVHLGWCDAHAPAYEPPPDEYWPDENWRHPDD